MYKFLLAAVALTIILTACKTDNPLESEPIQVERIEDNVQMERITAIDNDKQLTEIHSLDYNTNSGSRIEVIAYLNNAEQEVKIEEHFYDVKSGDYGTYIYYIENGRRFASREVYYDNQLKTPSFVERISHYDSNGKVQSTKERFATYENDLEDVPFSVGKPKDLPIDRAMRVLNQEQEFETTFQGFASDGTLNYLLVGENTPDGYASSLAVQYNQGPILQLMQNEKAMIGRKLTVKHDIVEGQQGMKFQILLSVEID